MSSVFSVAAPALSTDVPLKTLTWTSSPLRVARPTSTVLLTGSPIKMESGLECGMKRTRPKTAVRP